MLGAGAFGQVFLCYDVDSGVELALKQVLINKTDKEISKVGSCLIVLSDHCVLSHCVLFHQTVYLKRQIHRWKGPQLGVITFE